jgi:hypothetical protein
MFIDLVKAKKASKPAKGKEEEMSDERLDEIMSELFGTADKEQTKKGAGYKDKDRQEMLMRAEEEDDELDETEDDDEEMEKALDKKERRAMMSKVYSMVDDLSDSELENFLNNREMKKAQVMAIFDSMSDSDLHDFVSASDANGEGMKIAMNKAEQDQMDFEDMDEDEDMDKGSDYKMINGQELEKALEMLGIKVNR